MSLQNFKRCNEWRVLRKKEIWWDLSLKWLIMILEIFVSAQIVLCGPFSTTMIIALSVLDWTHVVQCHIVLFEWYQRTLKMSIHIANCSQALLGWKNYSCVLPQLQQFTYQSLKNGHHFAGDIFNESLRMLYVILWLKCHWSLLQ